jgi:sulfate transport system substrate-binding protein
MLEPISAGIASALLFATGTAVDKAGEEDEEDRPSNASKFAVVGVVIILIVAFVGVAIFWHKSAGGEVKVTIYGYSIMGEVMDGKILPAFKAYWKNKTGEDVTFNTNWAGSGEVTNQVIVGAPVQAMILSTEWDALTLKKNGFITTDWNTFPHKGTVSLTPFIIMTRHGNPKDITDFGDLATKNIKMVHPDPLTSGGACWSIFGMYGSELRRTNGTEGKPNTTKADALVTTVVKDIISYQTSARKSLSQFELGFGDALITYESDALLENKKANDYTLVYPKSTIISENKIVMIDRNMDSKQKEVVRGLIDFIYTQQSQAYFIQSGFRAVDPSMNNGHPEFGTIQDPFYVDYLGGWEKAHSDLIDDLFTKAKG